MRVLGSSLWCALACCGVLSGLSGTAQAASGVLVDLVSRQTVYDEHAETRVPVGAVNRVLVLHTFLRTLEGAGRSLSDTFTVATAQNGTVDAVRWKEGEETTYETVLAAYALTGEVAAARCVMQALYPSDEAFRDEAAAVLSELGIYDVVWEKTESGVLSVPHLSPSEVVLLAERTLEAYPILQQWLTSPALTFGEKTFANANLLRDANQIVTAVAVGAWNQRWSGVAFLENPLPDGAVRRLMAVSLDRSSQKALSSAIRESLQTGLRQFETLRLYQKGENIGTTVLYGAAKPEVVMTVPEDLYVTMPRRELLDEGIAALSLRFVYPTPRMAPVQAGEVLGTLTISMHGEVVKKTKVVSAESVTKGSLWQRLRDYVKLAVSRQWEVEKE